MSQSPTGRITNILILCTGNSARSILAEAILERAGGGRIRSFSAGSHPKNAPHPVAIALLAEHGYDTSRFRSKSWTEFAAPDAPVMDIVITVCDSAAGESCPFWPGQPLRAHWGIADPAAAQGPSEEVRAAFELAYERLDLRIRRLVALPIETLGAAALQEQLILIGRMEGATTAAAGGNN